MLSVKLHVHVYGGCLYIGANESTNSDEVIVVTATHFYAHFWHDSE